MEQETIAKGAYNTKIIRRLAAYALPHRSIIVFAFLAMLVSTVTELLQPVVLQRAIDSYILAGGEGAINGITRSCLFFLALLVGGMFFSFVETYAISLAGQKVMKDLRMALFRHILGRSLAFIGEHPAGRLVTRVTNDVETINELFSEVITSLLKDLFIMAGVVVTLFFLDVRLGLITVLTLPPVVACALVFRIRARDAFRNVRHWVSQANSFFAEHIAGIKIIQLFTRESRTAQAYGEINQNLTKSNLGEMYVFATFRPIIDFLGSLSLGIIVYFGALQNLEAGLSLGTFVAFINLIRKFYQPVMDIAEKYTILQSALVGAERIFQMMDDPRCIPDTGTQTLPWPLRGELRFQDVHFSYKKGESVLRGLSFAVRPGETFALVGYTGAGKTTVANLLTRLWDTDRGSITLDGKDIRSIPLAELRAAAQPIQQEVTLFSQSVRENIALGLDITGEELLRAARLAQAHDFISALPQGYDTVLQEGAVNLSAGQRQLLSFARILAHNPPIIILDEATSSIDTETEKLVQKALKTVLEGRTSIVIAHRLSTIRNASRILVLSEGRVIEEGTHEELLARGGAYNTLHRLQMKMDGGYSAGEENR
ncbi:MAG: ABC transporter ATP-binding protein/permease [Spirochaetia bacterium]|jgi:ATP-binding cassette subfamily B protein|nr:ABC transporter ATP-binding protein/permease [Spirochaetia bacterium]